MYSLDIETPDWTNSSGDLPFFDKELEEERKGIREISK